VGLLGGGDHSLCSVVCPFGGDFSDFADFLCDFSCGRTDFFVLGLCVICVGVVFHNSNIHRCTDETNDELRQ